MSTRVSPIECIRAQIDDLFGSERELGEVLEEVARLGVRLLMQTAIEAEVTEFLGRERYSHGERVRQGSPNGHCPTTIKTTAGPVKIDRPKLRGTDEAFASRLLGVGVCRTNALESLVIAGFVRGLSVRDVEASLADALGAEAALSKSTVSRVCEAIKDEFDTWKTRDLSEVELEYLFLDASHFRMHDGARAEPVLAAWGITTEGRPVLVGLDTGASESTDRLEGLPRRHGRPGPAGPAAGRLRRRPRSDRRGRTRLPPQSQTALCHPPSEERTGQGARRAPGRGQVRLLGHLRLHRRAARRALDRRGSSPSSGLLRHVRPAVPLRGRLPQRRPDQPVLLPALPRRAPQADPPPPTSSNGPSARPAGGSKSSAGSPANAPASVWSGPCSTGPAAAGEASP